ncbi:MAG: hypothetical protein OEY49_17870 [Candidatus Heimdallarchaeota archaeon]|nr:hypothetical protein [Candidatus Heimdallarchaeota archaeon]
MTSKTIMIDSEVYEELKLLKKNISFSQIIRELLASRNSPPSSIAGSLKDESDRLDYDEIKSMRKEKNVSF